MINVRKPPNKVPRSFLIQAEEELVAARHYYSRSRAKQFLFKAYRNRLLRESLSKIFANKCAYCEAYYAATQPVAIEHYRPKAMIVNGSVIIRPGYWWLAAAWSNLLPSCFDCNSPRRIRNITGHWELTGKGNQFPIANGASRAKREGDEKNEKPLLLNPSNFRIKPSTHLEFIFTDEYLPMLQPVVKKGMESAIGRESIRVYGLNRPQLVDHRQYTAKRVAAQIRSVIRAFLESKRRGSNKAREVFRRELEELRDLAAPGAPYSAMVKALIKLEFTKARRKELLRRLHLH